MSTIRVISISDFYYIIKKLIESLFFVLQVLNVHRQFLDEICLIVKIMSAIRHMVIVNM